MPPPSRDQSGYRQYADTDESRLRFIQDAKKLSLGLDQIRVLVSVMPPSGVSNCSHALQPLQARRQEITESIERAERLRRTLDRTIEGTPRHLNSPSRQADSCILDFARWSGYRTGRTG